MQGGIGKGIKNILRYLHLHMNYIVLFESVLKLVERVYCKR